MPTQDYNRYLRLNLSNGLTEMMPFVAIPKSNSDKTIYWNKEHDRFDKLANVYYENPFYDFFITFGNPEYLSEFDIPDGALIRIPFPISTVKAYYENFLDNYMKK
jgi:hypothetical protein